MQKILFLLMMPAILFGFDDTPACFTLVEKTFFSHKIVGEALSTYSVPQILWNNIVRDLNDETANLHKNLRTRARKLNPDPTEYPFNKKEALKLLQENLYDAYMNVMNKNKITNPVMVNGIFDYIQNANSKRISDCLGN